MEIKDHAKNTETWLRGFFILVFGVIFYVLYIVIWLVVIIQFVTKVLTGELNGYLEQCSTNMTSYAMQILNYITYQSEERPFPFSPFPGAEEKAPKKITKKKKTTSKKDGN